MYQLKLPYYPQIPVTADLTPGKIIEISHPELYNSPLANKQILRTDLLRCLVPIVGESCFICRDYLYDVIAGKGDYATLFGHIYRRHTQLQTYVSEEFEFGDPTVPLVDRCVEALRKQVNDYEAELKEFLAAHGAKYLVTTHCYLYVCFNIGLPIPTVEGGTLIC